MSKLSLMLHCNWLDFPSFWPPCENNSNFKIIIIIFYLQMIFNIALLQWTGHPFMVFFYGPRCWNRLQHPCDMWQTVWKMDGRMVLICSSDTMKTQQTYYWSSKHLFYYYRVGMHFSELWLLSETVMFLVLDKWEINLASAKVLCKKYPFTISEVSWRTLKTGGMAAENSSLPSQE